MRASEEGSVPVGSRDGNEARAQRALTIFITPQRYRLKPWEEAYQQSGERLSLAGLAALAWGHGPVVLLLHGWEGRGTQLGAFVAPLVAAGRRVIALDGPAHGASPGQQTNPYQAAQLLRRVGAELGPLAGIVGHSMGAFVTALALPMGLSVERVVLIAGPAALQGVVDRFSAILSLPPEAAARFAALVETTVGRPIAELELRHVAPGLTVPALVVHDRQDREVPFSAAEAIVATWPGAHLHATSGLGHIRILRDPTVVATAVAFLIDDRPGEPRATMNGAGTPVPGQASEIWP